MTKIIGFGNAIVDLLCKVEDNFVEQHCLVKGSMSLVEENIAHSLLTVLKAEKISSGGSAANTIANIANLGCVAEFYGTVGDNHLGQKFIEEIEKSGAKFIGKIIPNRKTATSFVLITPDAERTMCTFLGCAPEIDDSIFSEETFKDASLLYLEGYLWDKSQTINALKKAINLAKNQNTKIAFTLSDPFCVARHKRDFLDLILNDLDILFANEDEISELTNNKIFSIKKLQNFFSSNKKLTAVITRGSKGCIIFKNQKALEIPAVNVEKLVDTTGAGDSFSAGFLYSAMCGFDLQKSGEFGNLIASKIIQKFGARFEKNEIQNLKVQNLNKS